MEKPIFSNFSTVDNDVEYRYCICSETIEQISGTNGNFDMYDSI